MRVKLARVPSVGTNSHQEYLAALHDAVFRSQLPVTRTHSAPPRFRIVSGPPLGAGHASRCEYVDFELRHPISGPEFGRRLARELPPGLELLWQKRMPPGTPHLMASVISFTYDIEGTFDPQRAVAFAEATQWPVTRQRAKKSQTFDIKRSVTHLDVHPHGITLKITVQPDGTPKPEDVLAAVFGVTPEDARNLAVVRTAVTLDPSPKVYHQHREQS